MVLYISEMDKKERGARLKTARESLEPPFKPTDFARMLTDVSGEEVSQQRLWGWENRPSAPPDEVLMKAAELLGVRYDWLKNGEGLMRPPSLARGDIRVNRAGFRWIFIHGAIEAGLPTFDGGDVEPVEVADWGGQFERWGRFVVGNSMTTDDEDTSFEPGDIVIFEDRRAEPGQVVHANKDGEHAIKVLKGHGETLALHSMNPDFPPYSAKDFEIKGVAIERWRMRRKFPQKVEYPGGLYLRPPSQ